MRYTGWLNYFLSEKSGFVYKERKQTKQKNQKLYNRTYPICRHSHMPGKNKFLSTCNFQLINWQHSKQNENGLWNFIGIKKYKVPKIEHPSTHRTVLNGTVCISAFCQGRALLHVCLWKGTFCHGELPMFLHRYFKFMIWLKQVKGEIKLELHILSWTTVQIGGKHVALLLVPSPRWVQQRTLAYTPGSPAYRKELSQFQRKSAHAPQKELPKRKL